MIGGVYVTVNGGLLVVHSKAKLAVEGRRLLVKRVLAGSPVSHVAKQMGVSRQCAHRWVARFEAEGEAGLRDRSSRPHRCANALSPLEEAFFLGIRQALHLGRDLMAELFGISPATASRLIARAGLPRLHELDPVTGIRIRASRRTRLRYERPEPGDLIHIDVKKLGRIPDGGGWRVDGPDTIDHRGRRARVGFDYIHVAVDDRTRLAFVQVLPDERGETCARFLADAAAWFADHGIRIREVMTDNAKNYTDSHAFQAQLRALGARHIRTRPHCPWHNGKAERFNRTLQECWAYARPYSSNHERTQALKPWLDYYNYARPHTACGGQPPISRVSTT